MKRRHALLAASAAGVPAQGSMAVILPAAAVATGCSVSYTVQSHLPAQNPYL